jgi:gamma-polyglutamate synthase
MSCVMSIRVLRHVLHLRNSRMMDAKSQTLSLSHQEIKKLLATGQNPYWYQLHADLLEHLCDDFDLWPAATSDEIDYKGSKLSHKAQHLVHFLRYEINQIVGSLANLKNQFSDYSKRYTKALNDEDKEKYILGYAKELGATRRQLRQDARAFERWFGHDAVSDRYQRRHLETERYLSFVLQCLGWMSLRVLAEDNENIDYRELWQSLALERVIKPLLDYKGDKRVVISAFNTLAIAIRALPVDLQHSSVSEASLRFIYHSCFGSQSIWVQCEALQLLQSASPESLKVVLTNRLEYPKGNDDLFVRRKIVQIIVEQLSVEPELESLFDLVLRDTCPSVRQKLAEMLPQTKPAIITRYCPALLFEDAAQPVRASALVGLLGLLQREDGFEMALAYLQQSLSTEKERFVLRTGLYVCRTGLDVLLSGKKPFDKQTYLQTLLPAIKALHENAVSLAVRRYAAQTSEHLLLFADDDKHRRINSLMRFVNTIPPGKTRRIPKALLTSDDAELGRLLSVIAQKDFGFDIENTIFGRFITRGHAFGFRVWRFLHEFRHPSPDKRQAFRHTVGRLFWGEMRVPSAILSELAETKIPGEPLFMDTEDGWRGYLPLVDEVISALALGNKTTYFYHSEGISQLHPPSSISKRWLASWKISWHFADYARLRNWQEKSQSSAQGYLNALAELGIKVTFAGYGTESPAYQSTDSAVLRFFPAFFPALPSPGSAASLWEDFKDYFVSEYENSLYELAVFMAVAVAYFMGKNIYLYRQMVAARNSLPLVLGGWGTRGKSGTERIKAALINALGHSIVSKTTGCEAMFLHSHPFGVLREMFLFRPYDKATIWEQHALVCLADKLKCEVFLWECMGLTPSYVDILQRQWMRDDISTITNTYPDHEDIQGPAGVNIPQVMTNFIPHNGSLLTTEEQMRPILQAAALQRNTRFRPVGWLEAGLLADDVLARFPYDEHPFNIALVLAMGDELGIEHDFAIKEMADRVVADIGVLKTFPPAPWRSRRMEFVNGMSANERFGCLSNWVRCGFDKLSLEQNPDTWVTIVVNNRADRIARSRVFASIVVKDISYDRCVLIGNNLTGLVSYIKEAWAEWISTITLSSKDESPKEIMLRMAQRFRVPYTQELLQERLGIMVKAQNENVDVAAVLNLMNKPDALVAYLLEQNIAHHQVIVDFLRQGIDLLNSYDEFLKQIDQANDKVSDGLEKNFHDLLWVWFEQKLLVVEDYYATGNQVIEFIGNATPPGFYNKVMGIQNIKGTGLDFVYRWQAWDTCYKACQQLSSLSAAESALGLRALAAFQEYGILTEETVRATIAKVLDSSIAQNEYYQAELGVIKANLERSLESLSSKSAQKTSGNSWLSKINSALEAFLDAGDAVKRRKKANQIYKDLVAERISHERAALELQGINKRQKGGWLKIGQ